MQAYDLPDFHRPHRARLNPHLETAREHATLWARETGMFQSTVDSDAVWDEAAFGSADYALLCAHTHPDVPSSVLNTVTDWYVWGFYFHDHFLRVYRRTGDLDGAARYLAGLTEFMPLDGTPAPDAATPVQRGLANLWVRTTARMSPAWRFRFAQRTKNLLAHHRWELAGSNAGRVPNPVDYFERLRTLGGAPWSAELVEYAADAEVPDSIAGTRPMRILRDAFSDCVHLRNDIFSHAKDTQDDHEVNNGVLIIETFFGHDPRTAIDVTNDLLTSRLRQFENTAVTELPALFEEHRLDPVSRERALRYVRGLRDWQAGSHEWHAASSRYAHPSTGLPAVSVPGARLPALSETAVPTPEPASGNTRLTTAPPELPDFFMPFSTRMNRHLDSVRAHATAWAREMGMLGVTGVWDEDVFEAADYGLFSALAHPGVQPPELDLLTDWHVWSRCADDFFVEAFKRGRDLPGAKAFLARLLTFMPEDPTATPVPENPVERGLADLWARSRTTMSAQLRQDFPWHVEEFLESWLWELTNLIQRRVPDPVDHVTMRRNTAGASFSTALARHSLGHDLPDEIFRTSTMRALLESFSDIGPLRNDIFSYHKEATREGDVNNAVLAVARFFGCAVQTAVHILNDLVTARTRRFQHIAANDIPALTAELGLGTQTHEALLRFVEGLRNWMAGDLQWSLETGRYAPVPARPAAL